MKLSRVFAQLVLDYLTTAESYSAGVPSAEVCPLLIVDHGGDKPSTCMIVEGIDRGGNRVKDIAVVITHHMQLGLDADSGQVSPNQSAVWLGAIEARLRDDAAWWLWLAALPAERRAGWALSHVTFPALIEIRREETGEAQDAFAVEFFVMI